MVPIHDERVFVKDGRTSFTVRVQGLHLAEVFLPDDFSVEVEAIEAARAEESVEKLAVGHWRIGNGAASVMAAFVRKFLANDGFPKGAAVLAGDGENQVLVAVSDRNAVMHP